MRFRFASTVLVALILQITLAAGDRFVWEDQKDFAGGSDVARAVAIKGRTAVVAGTTNKQGVSALVVRAYNLATGALEWKDRTPAAEGISTSVFVVASGNRVFAAGYKDPEVCCGTDMFVRAYNGNTGRVRWSDTVDKGRDDLPQGIAASSAAVIVVGYGGNVNAPDAVNFLVRAYDPATGQVLWEDMLDRGAAVSEIAWNVAIDGDRVFVSGDEDGSVPGQSGLIVRAYDITIGTLLWEANRPDTSTSAIVAADGRVYVAGVTGGFANAYLGAFDQASGVPLWEDIASPGVFVDVSLKNNHVVATGWHDFRASLVRTYEADSGLLAWEAVQTPASGSEFFRRVYVTDTTVYAAGAHSPGLNQSDTVVRGFDLITGGVTFEDRRTGSEVSDTAVAGRRVVVVGKTAGIASDFLVRTYRFGKVATATPALSPPEELD